MIWTLGFCVKMWSLDNTIYMENQKDDKSCTTSRTWNQDVWLWGLFFLRLELKKDRGRWVLDSTIFYNQTPSVSPSHVNPAGFQVYTIHRDQSTPGSTKTTGREPSYSNIFGASHAGNSKIQLQDGTLRWMCIYIYMYTYISYTFPDYLSFDSVWCIQPSNFPP